MNTPPQAELIVALDVPDVGAAAQLVDTLPADVQTYKVGLQLYVSEGPTILDLLSERGKRVFLDLKFHDIPNTVASAVRAASRQGVFMLTVHAHGGADMIRAARDAAGDAAGEAPRVIAVTTLTSIDAQMLADIGVARPLEDHTLEIGRLAVANGADGLVCSPLEAAAFRDVLGADPLLVTPGIRPTGAETGDQKRVATPASAVAAGANFLVVGRPILQAPDPAAAAQAILDEIETNKGAAP